MPTARFALCFRILLALCLGCGVLVAQAQDGFLRAGEYTYLPGRLVIKLKPEHRAHGLQSPAIARVLAPLQVISATRKFPQEPPLVIKDTLRQRQWTDLSLVYTVHFAAPQDPLTIAVALSQLSEVQYAEPEFVYETLGEYTPNDPWINSQWYIDRIQARRAWLLCQGDTNVVVGFTDTSFMWDHQDLFPALRKKTADIPWDGIDNDEDGYVDNTYGWDMVGAVPGLIQPDGDARPWVRPGNPGGLDHGTMVAGLGAARTDNGMGITNPGFRCSFLPVKCSYDSDKGGNASIILGYDAIQYAASQGAHIINCSWGGTGYSLYAQDIVNYVTHNKNSLLVAAGGNELSNRVYYPAGYDGVLGVAGTDGADRIATTWGPHIDVLAPGSSATTHQSGGYWNSPVPYSSFASPLAAGCAALVRAYYPHFTSQQILHCLRMGADDVRALHTDPDVQANLGAGRINLYKSLTLKYPAISHLGMTATDYADELYRSNDTVYLVGALTNQLFPATNLAVTLESSSPWLRPLTNSQMLGQMASLSTRSLSGRGLSMQVLPGVPFDHVANLTLRYQDGMYQASQNLQVLLNPSAVPLASAHMQTATSRLGHWAYMHPGGLNSNGKGLQAMQRTFIGTGGMVVAQGAHLLHNMQRVASDTLVDFVQITPLTLHPATQHYDQKLTGRFRTTGTAPSAPKLEVTQELYGFPEGPQERLIIGRHLLHNPEGYTQEALSYALYHDAAISSYLTFDTVGYDQSKRLQFLRGYERVGSRLQARWLGVVWLQAPSAPLLARSVSDWELQQASDSTVLAMLQQSTTQTFGRNLHHFFGFRALQLGANETDTLGFAIVCADSWDGLMVQVAAAEQKYRCMFQVQPLHLPLPGTMSGCAEVTVDAAHADALLYYWSHNASPHPQVTLESSGVYTVQVTDRNGCIAQHTIAVTITPEPPVDLYVQDTLLLLEQGAATLVFAEQSGNDHTCYWTFGDGYGYHGTSGSYAYTAPGTYPLTLQVTDGACNRSFTQLIQVLQPAGRRSSAGLACQVWPQPCADVLQVAVPAWPCTLRLLDLQGKVLASQVLQQGTTPVHVPTHLANGLYVLEVTEGNARWMQKISVLGR